MNLKRRMNRLEATRPDASNLPIQVVTRVPTGDGGTEVAVVITGTDLGTISREDTETEGAFLRRVCALRAGGTLDTGFDELEPAMATSSEELALRYVKTGTIGREVWRELFDRVASDGRRIGVR